LSTGAQELNAQATVLEAVMAPGLTAARLEFVEAIAFDCSAVSLKYQP
jgi:hypothetical protein